MSFQRAVVAGPEGLPVHSAAATVLFTTLLQGGPRSRAELSRALAMSQAVVTRTVRPLLDNGYLVELPDQRAGTTLGRPLSPLQVVADRQYFVGVKATATELIGVLVDLRAQVRDVRHIPLASTAVDGVVDAIEQIVTALCSDAAYPVEELAGLGVAVTGDVDRESGRARQSPLLGWRDVPLATLLAQATGVPTVVENDVRALTVCEQWFGAGLGVDSFALVTIGAGIGCGLFLNGGVVAGAHGVAGEIGHLPLAESDIACTCGRTSCVETVASTAAILRDVRAVDGLSSVSMAEAVRLAHEGNEAVRAVFDRAGALIGRALAVVANLVGPGRIVLSGEGVADYDLYDQRIREALAAYAFGSAADCELIVRPLSFVEWARAAAVVAIETFVSPNQKASS